MKKTLLRRRIERLEVRTLLAADLLVQLEEPVDFHGNLNDGTAEVVIQLENEGLLNLHIMPEGFAIGSGELVAADGATVAESIDLPFPLPEILIDPVELSAGEYTLSLAFAQYAAEPLPSQFTIHAFAATPQDPVDPEPLPDEPDDFENALPIEGDANEAPVVVGYLDGADDVDVFAFDFSGRGELEIFGLPLGPGNYQVELFDAAQTLIASGDGSEAEPLFLSDLELTAGDYFLRLSGDGETPYFLDVHTVVQVDPLPVIDDYPDAIDANGPSVDLLEGHAPIDVFVDGPEDVDVVRIATPNEGRMVGHIFATGENVSIELVDADGQAVGDLHRISGPGLHLVDVGVDLTGEDFYLRVSTTDDGASIHADLIVEDSPAADTPVVLAADAAFAAAFASLEEKQREEVPPLDGDVNRDGEVNLVDFSLMKSSFGATGVDLPADFDGDGAVTLHDFALLKAAMGDV